MNKRYDKPIPLGWYAIDYSAKLQAGTVKPLSYFGRDAYCPHLGAHLGHGGKVVGDSISCPFHAWKYNGEGYCTDVPYAKRMPPKVDGKQIIRSYPVVEQNNMVWAWYHPGDAEPGFEVFAIPELSSPEWSEMVSCDWTFNSIIQETGENAADIAHFVTVHGIPDMPVGKVTMEGHIRRTLMSSEVQVIGEEGEIDRSGENLEAGHLESVNYGPGQTYQKFSRLFDIVMMGTLTPIDDQSMHMRFNFSMPKAQSEEHALYAKGFMDEIVHQVEQDIPIWENKVYLESPVLCDGDGPIAQYRKWFQQFYA